MERYQRAVTEAERELGSALLTELYPSNAKDLPEKIKEVIEAEPKVKEASLTVAKLVGLYEDADKDRSKGYSTPMLFSMMRRQ